MATKSTPPRLWTQSAIAEFLVIHSRVVKRHLQGVEHDGKVGGRYEGWLASTWLPYLKAAIPDPRTDTLAGARPAVPEFDPDTLDPKDRKDWWDGTRTQILLEKEALRLIPVEDHRRVMSLVVQAIINEFEPLADLLERDCGASPEMVIKTQELVDRVRQNAYEHAVVAIRPNEVIDDV